jgi:hypothetical protein
MINNKKKNNNKKSMSAGLERNGMTLKFTINYVEQQQKPTNGLAYHFLTHH